MDVGAVNSLSSGKGEKGHQFRAMGVLSAEEHIFNETAMQARTPVSNRLAKAIRASHGPRVSLQSQAKERVNRTMDNPKDSPKDLKVPKAQAKAKPRKTGISGLEKLEIRNKLGNSGLSANGTSLYR